MTAERVRSGRPRKRRPWRFLWSCGMSTCLFAGLALGGEKPRTRAAESPDAGQATHWPGLDRAAELFQGRQDFVAATLPTPGFLTAPGMNAASPEGARQTWELTEGWTQLAVEGPSGALGRPKRVTLPAAWASSTGTHAAWYVLRTRLAPRTDERLVLRFQRVSLFCVLMVNGKECGRHLGAFTPFEFDISDAVVDGENLLALYIHDVTAAVEGRAAYNQVVAKKPSDVPHMSNVFSASRAPVLERRQSASVTDVFVKTSTRRGAMDLVCELANPGRTPQAGQLEFHVVRWPDGAAANTDENAADGTSPLEIPARAVQIAPESVTPLTVSVPWKRPRLWSPEHPNLYVLYAMLRRGSRADTLPVRFGFREFWVEGKQFFLNGVPIRLRGQSFCGLVRGAPGRDACREYFLRSKEKFDVNACRVHAQIGLGEVFQGGDEAGMLLINQSSIWSNMGSAYDNGGERFMANTQREFAEWVRRDRNCPSVTIWDVENEQIRGQRERLARILRLDGFVRAHDDTRPVEHSGAGWYSPDQQIVHVHQHENYTRLLGEWRQRGDRPLVMGEFWVGGQGGEFRLTSSKEARSQSDIEEEAFRLLEIRMLEMRYYGVAGVMPFAITPAPPSRHAIQPATVFYWPRAEAGVAGGSVQRELVVANDRETAGDFEVEWGIEGGDLHTEKVHLAPAEQWRKTIEAAVADGGAQLVARLLDSGKEIARDGLRLRAIPADRLEAPRLARRLLVYEGRAVGTVDALRTMGVEAQAISGVPRDGADKTIWMIAPGASDTVLDRQGQAVRRFLESGGRVLCLAQDHWPRWSPIRLPLSPALQDSPVAFVDFGWTEPNKDIYYSQYATIFAPGHPAFAGIGAGDLRWWSARDGRVSDDALTRPAATGSYTQGAWRMLAGASRRENGSLAEARVGAGLVVFCQAQVLEERVNPEAQAVLLNLLRYLDGPGWLADANPVRLAGSLSAERIARKVGAPVEALTRGAPDHGGLLVAGDDASPQELAAWADAGGTVLVLSAETASRLPGFEVKKEPNARYRAARGVDHPLFWGVSSADFADTAGSCVEGELSAFPQPAPVLLYGLKGRSSRDGSEACGPVAVAVPHGHGQWIVTTLAPWKGRSAYDDELLSLLLANARVPNATPERQAANARALWTAAPVIDGRLDDWTSDVEDRNVSRYGHAEPIVLSSDDAVPTPLESDAQLSAIVYFLWDENALYAAGAVFGSDSGSARAVIRVGNRLLRLAPLGPGSKAEIEGQADADPRVAGAVLADPKELIDSRLLHLSAPASRIKKRGPQEGVSGRMFELKIPWNLVGAAAPPRQTRVLIRIERADGAAIQAPAFGTVEDPETWITLVMAP